MENMPVANEMSPIVKDRRNSILFALFVVASIISIWATYQHYIVARNFSITEETVEEDSVDNTSEEADIFL